MTTVPTGLTESLEREILICARRETVFRYFTDSERFARWWGEGSRIDPRPGGEVEIRYPNGVTASGEVLEIEPPRRIVFTYGNNSGIPANGSVVTIVLDETQQGTLVNLRHAFSDAKIRDHFVQGWRYQLALFSKTVAEEQHAGAAERVDAYLRAWGDPDANIRQELLESCASPAIVFRDAYSSTSGLEDLLAHLDAVQINMPGVRLERDGEVRISHGTAIAGWLAKKKTGETLSRGTNVYDFSPHGLITRVVGFWEK